MQLSIVIVNYNTHIHLEKCLFSIKSKISNVEYEVIIVDNNSPNRAVVELEKKFREFRFYYNDVNDGFGAGCNFGAKKSDPSSKYLVFVNPDITFINNSLIHFFEFMESNEDSGVCSGLLVNSKNEKLYSYNHDMNIKWELMGSFNLGIEIFKNKLLKRDEIQKGIPFEIDWALGAVLFVRKEAFNAVGGFDEDFFLYTEDNDLQYRIRKIGYKVVCLPCERIMHYYGSSMEDVDSKSKYNHYFYMSKMLYAYKHFNFLKRNIIRIILISGLLLRIIKYIFWPGKSIKIIKEQFIPALYATFKKYTVKPLLYA